MSFQFDVDEKALAGASLISDTIVEIQKAFAKEKRLHKLTQQSLADRLKQKHRSVVNRWLQGKENLSLRTIGELAWALNRRAVIVFEELDSSGNFFEKRANQVDASQKRIYVHNDKLIEAWEAVDTEVHASKAVLENA